MMMMMAFAGYPGMDPDDLERLNALASSTTREPMTFDEAYALLKNDSPRDVAERAWNDFLDYYTPAPGEAPPEPAEA
jgi:hypothetical protein